jgi:hypothetical protein
VTEHEGPCTLENPWLAIVVSDCFQGMAFFLDYIFARTPECVEPVSVFTTIKSREDMSPWFEYVDISSPGSPHKVAFDRLYSFHAEDQDAGSSFALFRRDIFRVLNAGHIGLLGMTQRGFDRFIVAFERRNRVTTRDPKLNPLNKEIPFTYVTIRVSENAGPELERSLKDDLFIKSSALVGKELRTLVKRFSPQSVHPPPRRSGVHRRGESHLLSLYELAEGMTVAGRGNRR